MTRLIRIAFLSACATILTLWSVCALMLWGVA